MSADQYSSCSLADLHAFVIVERRRFINEFNMSVGNFDYITLVFFFFRLVSPII